MAYVSTRGHAGESNFEEVLLRGLAPDGGLYVPNYWPRIGRQKLREWRGYDYPSLAQAIISKFISPGEILRERLGEIVHHAYGLAKFPGGVAPVKRVSDEQYLLELYHGPTFAFKDIALQFLALAMQDVLDRHGEWTTIVGATSGDTGSAAIEAFRGHNNVNIFVLYPDQHISEIQRRQMTTVKEANVFPIPIFGTFDDCQRLVKGLFRDERFRQEVRLSAINSINWARIVAQVPYYFYGYFQVTNEQEEILDVCVPTGNFGNIFAGYIAKQMGLPLRRLIIATNENDALPRTIHGGLCEVMDVVKTRAPSMDIQIPSNFERLLYFCCGQKPDYVSKIMNQFRRGKRVSLAQYVLKDIRDNFSAYRVLDSEIDDVIKGLYQSTGTLIDPHTACGYAALKAFKSSSKDHLRGLLVGTADPAKFRDEIKQHIGIEAKLPEKLRRVLTASERELTQLPPDEEAVKQFISANVRGRVALAHSVANQRRLSLAASRS